MSFVWYQHLVYIDGRCQHDIELVKHSIVCLQEAAGMELHGGALMAVVHRLRSHTRSSSRRGGSAASMRDAQTCRAWRLSGAQRDSPAVMRDRKSHKPLVSGQAGTAGSFDRRCGESVWYGGAARRRRIGSEDGETSRLNLADVRRMYYCLEQVEQCEHTLRFCSPSGRSRRCSRVVTDDPHVTRQRRGGAAPLG